jgi:hypothetical protein
MAEHLTRMIVEGFNKGCVSNAVDSAHDDMLWNDIEEVGNIRIECEEEGSTDCEDGHSELINKGR